MKNPTPIFAWIALIAVGCVVYSAIKWEIEEQRNADLTAQNDDLSDSVDEYGKILIGVAAGDIEALKRLEPGSVWVDLAGDGYELGHVNTATGEVELHRVLTSGDQCGVCGWVWEAATTGNPVRSDEGQDGGTKPPVGEVSASPVAHQRCDVHF